jgi:hypothetical protein
MSRLVGCAATAAALVVAPATLAGTTGLPDLVPLLDLDAPVVQRHQSVDPRDLAEGCAGGLTDRTLLRFTLGTENDGTGDLVLGNPGCPDCMLEPGPTCTNPLFECSPVEGHDHAHFSQYALYEVLPTRDASAVAVGHKQGFCLEDTCEPQYYTCDYQGLTVGCQDVYPWSIGCQYVDVTDLPGGRYVLRATVNYAHILPELNYDNNVAETVVDVCEGVPGVRGTLRRKKNAPNVLKWKLKSARRLTVAPGLVDPDPRRDGARVQIETDGAPLLDVVIPGRPGTGHCGPKDGWKKEHATYTYVNTSGYLDRGCTVPAGGLRGLKVSVRHRTPKSGPPVWKLRYKLIGKTPFPDDPRRLRTTVVLGADTGPCWTGASTCGGGSCESDSASLAFVDFAD